MPPAAPSTNCAGKAKKPQGEKEVLDFILKRFRDPEMEELKNVFKKSSAAIEKIVTEGSERAMNEFN